MKRYRNNKGRIIRYKMLVLCSMLCAGILLMWMLYPDKASSGPYLDSAHGNTTYGVNRTGLITPTNFGYSKGNCTHCHEQHAMIGGSEPSPNSPAGPDYYTLFMDLWVNPPQSNLFCYGCHIGSGSLQSSWSRTNYCYSYWRGGDTTLTCPASVYESFQFVTNAGASQLNCSSSVGSSHLIPDLGTFMSGKVGFPITLAYINPCSACHNPHRAKRDYPCSRPSAHTNLATWNVWGDDASERMNALTANYWAPLKVGGGYEPDGCATIACQNGSNTPDYASLCSDCHNSANTIYSNRLGRNLRKITWTAAGDFHGNKPRNDSGMEWGDLLPPYKVDGSYAKANYLLSCTDCHEPHGSPNEFLLRKTVNSSNIATIAGLGQWYYWCRSCHVITTGNPMHTTPTYDCFGSGIGNCHSHGNAGYF